MQGAWQVYDELLSDQRVVFAEEPDDFEIAWRLLSARRTFSPKVWNDAYLAAFAQTADFEIVTFDKGFSDYKKLRCTILS